MAGERPTPQPNLPDQAQEQARQELLGRFTPLADRLLEPAVQHTEAWRRAIYGIPPERTQAFYDEVMQSGLSGLVKGHTNPETREEYPTERPDGAYIIVEEFDHTNPRGSKRTELEVGLRYAAQDGEFNDFRIVMTAGKPQATSYVFSSEYAETGYEGHNWRTQELDVNQLKDFYNLLVYNTTTRVPEKPMEEQMAEIKLVNEQTGQELFYDPEEKDWRPLEGEKVEAGNDEELNASNPYADKIRVKASYKIQPVKKKQGTEETSQ